MALATNTTVGSVVLGGDLTGNANAPELRVTGVTAGSYTYPTLVIDAKGRVIYAVGSSALLAGDVTGSFGATTLTTTGVTPGSYTATSITVDSKGRISLATSGSQSGLAGDLIGPLSANYLSTTGVTAAPYTNVGIVVDSKGRITSATTGSISAPASFTAMGIVQIQSTSGLSITAGVLSGVLASNATYGVIKSADATAIYIISVGETQGSVNVGSNVPQLNVISQFTKAQSVSSLTVSTNTLTPDIALYNQFYIPSGVGIVLNAPVNATFGSIFSLFGSSANTVTLTTSNWGGDAIAWNGSLYCKVSNGKIETSPNGVTWTDRTTPVSSAWTAITWSGTQFCVVSKFSNRALTSPNGVTWTLRSLPETAQWVGISWGGGRFIAVAYDISRVAISTDGVTWSSQNSLMGGYDIAWNGTLFCVVGGTGVSTSADGTSWSAVQTTAKGVAIVWNGTLFCIAGGSIVMNTVYRSNNTAGTSWSAYTVVLDYPADIAWSGTQFCMVGTGLYPTYSSLLVSADGITWTEVGLADDSDYYCVATDGSSFVASGASIVSGITNLIAVLGDYTSAIAASSVYKFSNTIPNGAFVLTCVATGTNVYCTYS